MSQSEFKQGLRAGVPADIVVAAKFGERRIDASTGGASRELHDCGLVYAKDEPYLLCVMTRGNDFQALAHDVAEISALVYQHQQK